MTKEKQIKEMTEYIDTYIEGVDVKHWYRDELDEGLAEYLYNAGYRKASDVAREIFAELESKFLPKIFAYNSGGREVFKELKKKYESEKD